MKLVLIIIAFVVALLVAYGVSTFIMDEKKPEQAQILSTPPVATEPPAQKVDIYVAQRDLPIGTTVAAGDFEVKPWPQHLLPPGAVVYGAEGTPQIEGMITSTPIVKDEPLLLSKLRNPNDPSFIAGQLGEGMRAITVPATLTSSVAGFIAPGDKVDVIFTYELNKGAVQGSDVSSTKGEGADQNLSFSEVMIPNVKVIAVDTRVVANPAPADPNAGGEAAVAAVPASVTLEVNLRDAQKLKLAQKIGDLTLVLRSVKDKDSYDLVRPTAEQDLSRILPPAYFPVLFDSDAAYDYGVVDLYGSNLTPEQAKATGIRYNPETGRLEKKSGENDATWTGNDKDNPRQSVNVYRGVQLEKVEVNKP